MKKIIIFIITFSFISAFVLCGALIFSGEDFAPYKESEYRETVRLKGNALLISEIESELLEEAGKYLEEPEFGYFEYLYKDGDYFTATFYFSDGKDLGEMAKTLHIDVNINDNSIYLCRRTYGLSKRISETSLSDIPDFIKETDMEKLISDTLSDKDYKESTWGKDHFIKITPGYHELIISAGTKEELLLRKSVSVPNI